MQFVPDELYIEILLNLQEDSIFHYDIQSILSFGAVCRKFYTIIKDNLLWKKFCMKFPDYDRLLHMYNNNILDHWKSIYRMRIIGTYKSVMIPVGEHYMLIQLKGDGRCYISAPTPADRSFDIRRISNDSYLVHENEYTFCMIPLCSNQNKAPSMFGWINFDIDGQPLSIVDISCCAPTVLILSYTGLVFEWLCVPDYVEGFRGFVFPVKIKFPKNTTIIRIFATTIASYAISDDNKLYAWTIVDHPTTMRKIRIDPVLINLPISVINIEQRDNQTVFYGIDQNLVVNNIEIFAIIIENNI